MPIILFRRFSTDGLAKRLQKKLRKQLIKQMLRGVSAREAIRSFNLSYDVANFIRQIYIQIREQYE